MLKTKNIKKDNLNIKWCQLFNDIAKHIGFLQSNQKKAVLPIQTVKTTKQKNNNKQKNTIKFSKIKMLFEMYGTQKINTIF